jgi:hypothetical protein
MEEIPCNDIIDDDCSDLRDLAKKQIARYLYKIELDKMFNYSKNKEMYVREINKVIIYERKGR